MTEYAIRLKDITKSYNMYAKPSDRFREALNPFKKSYHDVFYALKNVNVEIKKGEMIGFVGENGSGKSTMLKIITGVLTPTSGTMEIEGKISALLELGSGFNPEYSGYENIYLNGMVLGFSREEVDEMVDDIIEFADIGDHIYQPVKTYSSGMFVRLAFAVAINVNPDILIVDEALAVGDLEFQLKCMEKFTEIKNSGKTILFVSHDISSIRRFCDRSYWLKNGEVVEYGDPVPSRRLLATLFLTFGGSYANPSVYPRLESPPQSALFSSPSLFAFPSLPFLVQLRPPPYGGDNARTPVARVPPYRSRSPSAFPPLLRAPPLCFRLSESPCHTFSGVCLESLVPSFSPSLLFPDRLSPLLLLGESVPRSVC